MYPLESHQPPGYSSLRADYPGARRHLAGHLLHRSGIGRIRVNRRGDERLPGGDVGELFAAKHIARGVDMSDVGAETIVDGDSALGVRDAGAVERETLHVRLPPRCDEQAVATRFVALAGHHERAA